MNRIIKIINRHLDDLVSQMEKDNDTYIMIVNEDFYLINDFGKISGLETNVKLTGILKKRKKIIFSTKSIKLRLILTAIVKYFCRFIKLMKIFILLLLEEMMMPLAIICKCL